MPQNKSGNIRNFLSRLKRNKNEVTPSAQSSTIEESMEISEPTVVNEVETNTQLPLKGYVAENDGKSSNINWNENASASKTVQNQQYVSNSSFNPSNRTGAVNSSIDLHNQLINEKN